MTYDFDEWWEDNSQWLRKHLEAFGEACLNLVERTDPDTEPYLRRMAGVMYYLEASLLEALRRAALLDDCEHPPSSEGIRELLVEAIEAAIREEEAPDAECEAEQEALERTPKDVGPTTVCFDCGGTVPISDSWRSTTRDVVLCEPCFQKAEAAGRAREGSVSV